MKEAQKNNTKVHFSSLMDLCHLKNSELEPQFQKCKGRVVLRGDIVKDDSGAHKTMGVQAFATDLGRAFPIPLHIDFSVALSTSWPKRSTSRFSGAQR